MVRKELIKKTKPSEATANQGFKEWSVCPGRRVGDAPRHFSPNLSTQYQKSRTLKAGFNLKRSIIIAQRDGRRKKTPAQHMIKPMVDLKKPTVANNKETSPILMTKP
jgi:hypothetical protein